MNIRNTIAALLIAASGNAMADQYDIIDAKIEKHSWRQCMTKFQKKATPGYCGSSGCMLPDGTTVEDYCGEMPADYLALFDQLAAAGQEREDRMRAKRAKEKARRDAITITLGSPESDVIAKFGQPEEVNRTVTAAGVSKQMVYGSTYIYTDDGVVTAWQD